MKFYFLAMTLTEHSVKIKLIVQDGMLVSRTFFKTFSSYVSIYPRALKLYLQALINQLEDIHRLA